MKDICTRHPRFYMFYIKGLSAAAQLVRPEQRVPDGLFSFISSCIHFFRSLQLDWENSLRVIYKINRKTDCSGPPHASPVGTPHPLNGKFVHICHVEIFQVWPKHKLPCSNVCWYFGWVWQIAGLSNSLFKPGGTQMKKSTFDRNRVQIYWVWGESHSPKLLMHLELQLLYSCCIPMDLSGKRKCERGLEMSQPTTTADVFCNL